MRQHKHSRNAMRYVREKIDHIRPIYETDDPFTVQDVDIDARAANAMLTKLRELGVVQTCGQTPRRETRDQSNMIHEWEFCDEWRETIAEIIEDMHTLPCGHRWHIHHGPDGFGCKICDDDYDWSKKVIRENAP